MGKTFHVQCYQCEVCIYIDIKNKLKTK